MLLGNKRYKSQSDVNVTCLSKTSFNSLIIKYFIVLIKLRGGTACPDNFRDETTAQNLHISTPGLTTAGFYLYTLIFVN